jgi:hypothetical protein
MKKKRPRFRRDENLLAASKRSNAFGSCSARLCLKLLDLLNFLHSDFGNMSHLSQQANLGGTRRTQNSAICIWRLGMMTRMMMMMKSYISAGRAGLGRSLGTHVPAHSPPVAGPALPAVGPQGTVSLPTVTP